MKLKTLFLSLLLTSLNCYSYPTAFTLREAITEDGGGALWVVVLIIAMAILAPLFIYPSLLWKYRIYKDKDNYYSSCWSLSKDKIDLFTGFASSMFFMRMFTSIFLWLGLFVLLFIIASVSSFLKILPYSFFINLDVLIISINVLMYIQPVILISSIVSSIKEVTRNIDISNIFVR